MKVYYSSSVISQFYIAEKLAKNIEFQYGQNKTSSCTFREYRPIMKSIKCAELKHFQFGQCCTDKKLSVNTFMDKVTPIVEGK